MSGNSQMKIHMVLLLVLAGMIYPLLKEAQTIHSQTYHQVHSILNHIVRLDASSEENMMQLKNSQIANYDELTSNAKALQADYAKLMRALPDDATLRPLSNKLKASIQVQLDAIDQFRRTFGVLQNSKRYLSTLIAQHIQEQPSLRVRLLQLRGDLFEYLSMPDEGLRQRIVAQQRQLKSMGLDTLTHHIDVILQDAPQIQDEIYAVTHCGTPTYAYQLSNAYDVLFAEQLDKLKVKRTQLFALLGVFAIYLLIVLYLLMQSDTKLRRVIQSLEASEQSLNRELEKRAQAEKRYRALVDASSAAIMTYADNHFISANSATLRMFAIDSVEDILRMGPADLSPEIQADGRDSASAARAYIATAMESGHCSFEWLHRRANGEVFPAHVQLTAITIDREPVLQAVVTDLSNLKRLESEKNLLANALEHTADAILITDEAAKILYVNAAFVKLTGYSPEDLQGQYASILRSRQVDASLYEHMLEQLKRGKTWRGELWTRLKSGQEILTERTISSIFDAQGHVTHHIALLRDITEEKEQAKRWEHTQRLESLGVLAGGIAHDFNNILTAIMGNAALAERSLDEASPAKEKLATIEVSAQRAADLCQQMLAYSGKGKFVTKLVDLSKLVDEMVHLIEVSIEKNVVIKYHLAEHLPAVEVDVAQVQQVILNLITNANEAIGSRSGVISFSTGVMTADQGYLDQSFCDDGVPEGRFAYIEVSDTGCGMDHETIKKIFDPFFTTKFTGRGLGMSAVLGIIRGHHGALRVYSEVGRGTTFKVLFPVSEEALVEEATAESESDWQAEGAILVVDDEDTIREVAAMMLEDLGFSTLTAVDGMQAIELFRQHRNEIRAVLLDMTMPKMDGKACFRELRRIDPDVKVILSSGYSEEDATARFSGKKLAGFVQKPYSPEQLKAVVMQACRADIDSTEHHSG